MSTAGPPSSATDTNKRSLSVRFKRRISRILKKDDAKGATTASPTIDEASISKPSEGITAPTSQAVTKPDEVSGLDAPSGSKAAAPPTRPKAALNAEEYAKAQEEKVRALFAKYNVTLEVGEWTPPFKVDLPRVEKKIRMRVRRTCHRCSTQFGIEKVCRNCTHNCCKKCPRYPPRKKDEHAKPTGIVGVTTSKAEAPGEKRPLTQRTRMVCHECQTPFKSKTKACANCKHERCAQCKRLPPKSDTIAGVGAGSAPPKTFIKWTCHECDNVHRDIEDECLKCGHNKCDTCKRETVSQSSRKPKDNSTSKPSEDRPQEKSLPVPAEGVP